MPRIFLSYYREDTGDIAIRLCELLQERFGRGNVDMDVEPVLPGVDSRQRIAEVVARCDVLLVLIGEHWLDMRYPDGPKKGQRRLDDPDDYVRIEIQIALEGGGLRVIPVLVSHAKMPCREDLPDALKQLALKTAVEVGIDSFEDIQRLAYVIESPGEGEEELTSRATELEALQPADDFKRWIAEARAGSPAAWESLFDDTYRSYLLAEARRKLGDVLRSRFDPEDVVVETFVKALQHFSHFRGETKKDWLTWLRVLLHGIIWDIERRSRSDRRSVQGENLPDLSDESAFDLELCDLCARPLASGLFAGSEKGKMLADFLAHSWRRLPAEGESLPSPKDPVDCTVFAPPRAARGQTVMVQVFAHLPPQADIVEELAQQLDDEAEKRGFKSLEMDIARGTKLTFHLVMPEMQIDGPIQSLTWRGQPSSVAFAVTVPKTHKLGGIVGTVAISQDSIPLGHVHFKLTIDSKREKSPAGPSGEKVVRYRKAFISYASPDRAEVLKRVQMLRQVDIDFFQDLLSLEPGDRWEKQLYRHIDDSDLFLLFWSTAARSSEWVMKEVRYAMNRKGNDDEAPPEIKPVMIEGPPPPPPPAELAHLHFNDYFIYFIGKG